MIKHAFFLGVLLIGLAAQAQWETLKCTGTVSARHECAAAIVGNHYYLMGGRGSRPVNRLNVQTQVWDSVAPMPLMMHHFQTVVVGKDIYVMGAFTGGYPHEKPVENIWIFNTTTHAWRKGAAIPAERLRGAAGVVVYQQKIYMVAGIIDGHYDGHVAWFDEYDPATNKWRVLPDAPHSRDHFQGAVVGNKLVVAGGRRSSAKTNEVFTLTESAVDVFDFKKNIWTTLPEADSIPTARAGCTAIVAGHLVGVIGGESGKQATAHQELEWFNTKTMHWQRGAMLNVGRHGTQAAVWKNNIIVGAGSAKRGGGPELADVEMIPLQR